MGPRSARRVGPAVVGTEVVGSGVVGVRVRIAVAPVSEAVAGDIVGAFVDAEVIGHFAGGTVGTNEGRLIDRGKKILIFLSWRHGSWRRRRRPSAGVRADTVYGVAVA